MTGQIIALGGGGFSMEPDNLALHFDGTKLVNVVVSRPGALAYHVTLANGQVTDLVH
jgi:hypothetical protein